MTGVLELDADSVVFYVGGYPDDFKVTRDWSSSILSGIYLLLDGAVIDLFWY